MRAIAPTALLTTLLTACACAQDVGGRNAADTTAVLTTALRTAVDLGLTTASPQAKPEVVCLEVDRSDPTPEMIHAVRDTTDRLLRPRSACRIDAVGTWPGGRSRVVDSLTGRPGIVVRVSHLRIDAPDTVAFQAEYLEHGLSSATWDCTGHLEAGRWVIRACRRTRLS